MSKFKVYKENDEFEYFFNLEEIADGVIVTLVGRNGNIHYNLLRIDEDGITRHEGIHGDKLPFKTTTEGTIVVNK